MKLEVTIPPFEGTEPECPIEEAIRSLEWVEDAFVGTVAIDVLSNTGKVARFGLDIRIWAQIRKWDDSRHGGGCILELTGKVIGELKPVVWKGRTLRLLRKV